MSKLSNERGLAGVVELVLLVVVVGVVGFTAFNVYNRKSVQPTAQTTKIESAAPAPASATAALQEVENDAARDEATASALDGAAAEAGTTDSAANVEGSFNEKSF